MDIVARIRLEASKFKTNAKVVGQQFKLMGRSGHQFSKNVDKYIEQTAKNQRRSTNMTAKEEADSYSRRMQAIRAFQKQKTKAELEAVRNKGGIKPGTTAGMPLKIEERLSKESLKLVRKRQAVELNASNKIQAARRKEAQTAVALVNKREKNELRASNKIVRSRNKEATQAVKSVRRREKADTRYSNRYLKARRKESKEAVKSLNDFQKKSKSAFAQATLNSEKFERSMAATRYALYDISQRLLGVGTAAAAGLGAMVVQAAKFESAFTSVERTAGVTGEAAVKLKNQLLDMATSIPVAFEDLTKIATLGAQLGISADALASFTDTVAKFSAITGIGVEQVGLSFGRLAQLMKVPESEFENLSSAIAFTGVNAVATDNEILRMAESIGAAGNLAGLSAADIVGFSSALASLKVRPEQARGVFIRLFRTIDVAVEQGGQKMDDFAKVVGMTTESAQELYRQDPTEFFKKFLYGAEAAGSLNETMQQLGITNVRELDMIQRLAGNMGVLEAALADTNEQYLLADYATEAYGLVVDDLSSKFQIMQNAIAEASSEFGNVLAPAIKVIVDAITALAKGLANMPQGLKVVAIAIAAVAAGAALFFGSLAAGIAGLLALKLAMKNLSAETGLAGISIKSFETLLRSMIPTLAGTSVAARGASAAISGMSIALRAIPWIGLASLVAAAGVAIFSLGSKSDEAKNKLRELGEQGSASIGGIAGAFEAMSSDTAAFNKLNKAGKDTTGMFKELTFELTEAEKATVKNKEAFLDAAKLFEDRTSSQFGVTEAFDKTSEAIDSQNDLLKENKDLSSEGIDGDEDMAYQQGEQYVLWLSQAVRKTIDKEGNEFDFLKFFEVELDPATKAAAEAFGFDYMKVFDAAVVDAAGDNKGAQAYIDSFQADLNKVSEVLYDVNLAPEGSSELEKLQFALDRIKLDPSIKKELVSAFKESGLSAFKFADSVGNIGQEFDDLGTTADAINYDVIATRATDANDIWMQSQARINGAVDDTGEIGEEAAGKLKLLNDNMKALVESSTEAERNNQKIAASLRSVAESAIDTNGEIFGLSEDTKTNMDNFTSFMKQATDAAIDSGDGVGGALTTIITGLSQLDNSGVNTQQMFVQFKDTAKAMLGEAGSEYSELLTQLNKTTDLSGLRKIIIGFYNIQLAASRAAGEAVSARVTIINELNSALESLKGTVSIDVETGSSTGKTKTALDKLQESIEKIFAWSNKKIDLQDTLNDFGKSLRENGKDFSVYSESGRKGVSSIMTVIDELAVQSGGNLQRMANSLATFRQSLVNAGVPASGLLLVDRALASTGKTGKVSAQQLKEYERAIKGVGDEASDAERALLKVAAAATEFSSSVASGLNARFALSDSYDAISLAQLDMADSAEEAKKQIDSLTDSIEDNNRQVSDAKDAIEEANAEISKLTADKSTLEYQLQIAIKYGDTLRANEIRAQIEGINSDITSQKGVISDANKDITDAQKANFDARSEISDIQTKNTRETIEESKSLRELAGLFATLTGSLIANADEGEDLNGIIADQVQNFKNTAEQMGFTTTEINEMATALEEELIFAMGNIPEEIKTKVSVETDAALQSVSTFATKAKARLDSIPKDIVTRHTTYERVVSSGSPYVPGGFSANPTHKATGGFISGPGTSTSDSIPAMLSDGEYVIQASTVSRYGVDFFNNLNQMRSSSMSAPSVPAQQGGGGNQMVFLSPEDRGLLQQAINRPVNLYSDSTVIAKTANDGNKILAQRGIN